MDDKVITDSIRLWLLRKRNTMDVGHECSKRGANNSRMPRQGLDTRQIDCRVDWGWSKGKERWSRSDSTRLYKYFFETPTTGLAPSADLTPPMRHPYKPWHSTVATRRTWFSVLSGTIYIVLPTYLVHRPLEHSQAESYLVCIRPHMVTVRADKAALPVTQIVRFPTWDLPRLPPRCRPPPLPFLAPRNLRGAPGGMGQGFQIRIA